MFEYLNELYDYWQHLPFRDVSDWLGIKEFWLLYFFWIAFVGVEAYINARYAKHSEVHHNSEVLRRAMVFVLVMLLTEFPNFGEACIYALLLVLTFWAVFDGLTGWMIGGSVFYVGTTSKIDAFTRKMQIKIPFTEKTFSPVIPPNVVFYTKVWLVFLPLSHFLNYYNLLK